jgi:hypothetical protein
MSDTNTNTNESTATEAAPSAEQPAQLQIGDIEAAVKVIDYASEQGAFRGWNVVQEVLVLRNRLVHFVRSVTPPSEETAETTETDADENRLPPVGEVPEAPGATA